MRRNMVFCRGRAVTLHINNEPMRTYYVIYAIGEA